jgi:hypothetical protein
MLKTVKPYILVPLGTMLVVALGYWWWSSRQPAIVPPTTSLEAEFDFKPDVARLIARIQHDQIVFGYLDAQGEFLRERRLPPVPPQPGDDASVRSPPSINSNDETSKPLPPTSTWVVVINKARRPHEPVYEFRSGSLIAGTLDHDGNFVPEVDSEILAASKYRYSPTARRIYNLPGTFVPKNPQPSDPTPDLY